ncbi:hypothetical protein Pyn_26255 [Prunus yedoensis var. nudiflora]|uniref:Uncharacterized protein n=1 Tax=Prunus yedoensis var. nudiflora TaxID=2094558 RepID=A0A314UPY6_PRUYE|nr:hypothetical protein Pyn_26255 [Prunus yedoensis var. nudiflora]
MLGGSAAAIHEVLAAVRDQISEGKDMAPLVLSEGMILIAFEAGGDDSYDGLASKHLCNDVFGVGVLLFQLAFYQDAFFMCKSFLVSNSDQPALD